MRSFILTSYDSKEVVRWKIGEGDATRKTMHVWGHRRVKTTVKKKIAPSTRLRVLDGREKAGLRTEDGEQKGSDFVMRWG